MPESTEKERLDNATYEAINSTLKSDGWKHIEALLIDEYHAELTKLIDKGDISAGGAVRFVKTFFEKLNSKYKFAQLAHDRFIEKHLK